MSKNSISFFAARADLECFLCALSKGRSLKFAVAGLFDSAAPLIIQGLCENPGLGLAPSGNAVTEHRYLMFDSIAILTSSPGGTKPLRYTVEKVTPSNDMPNIRSKPWSSRKSISNLATS